MKKSEIIADLEQQLETTKTLLWISIFYLFLILWSERKTEDIEKKGK